MRNIKYTPQGFSYVDVSLKDIRNWGGYGICDGCGKGPFNEMKLIWVFHDTYCNDCFNKWIERCKNYSKSDIEYDLSLQKDSDIPYYEYLLKESVK